MSVGLGVTKADIDNKAGAFAIQLRDTLRLGLAYCDWLNDTSIWANDAALTALGYTGAEVTLLRASFTDAKAMYNVAHGALTVPVVNDFFFNLKHLTGAVV